MKMIESQWGFVRAVFPFDTLGETEPNEDNADGDQTEGQLIFV